MNSELSYASQPVNVEPEPAPQNIFSRLIGVLFSPGDTFQEIGRAPRVLIPTLILVILASVGGYMVVNKVGFENIVRRQMESLANSGIIPQDKLEEITQQSLTPAAISRGKIQAGVTPGIMMVIILLITAGLFKIFSLMMGYENTFKKLFSVTTYAFLAIALITTAVMLISISLKDPSDIDLYNPIGSNLGAMLPAGTDKTGKFLVGLSSYLDVFGIWRLALLSIGFAAVTRKLKTGTAAIFLTSLYILAALLGAAMSSVFG